MLRSLPKIDAATLIAFGCILLLLAVGAAAKPGFLSVGYLAQQLQVASFLGTIATGEMIVILMGQIDLSIPWTIAMGGMMATGATGILGPGVGVPLAIPFGIFCGIVVGLVNGLGVAYLRAPSMIFTLGMNAVAQGLMVYHTGGFAPQDRATGLMIELAGGQLVPGIPNPLLVWIAVGAVTVYMLTRTKLGRQIYAIGNRERAVFLSGVDSRRVTLIAFALSGACAAAGGVLLAGWANRSYQAMGDPYLLPTIAAIVLGGTNVLGGRGTYLGTIAGVILITLLQSILSVLQPQDYFAEIGVRLPADVFRQVVFGLVIIVMMMLYGREKLMRQ
ncbi:monosaccharide ABC transporter membrane protein (CUT2 family) [Trinickia symbiotica]|uniref:ABC transporter permease n=1 Tax=Trinickia symbiotica TaxID=863227 RepID=A0A2N7X9B1_9BURK|nr:ABC transporter permease [Trinickia symbiotica]PMS38142.1 ABC transporter permease [Trinickia symbiotica]PPK47178.1 monosaccharide ABC transporter membrane protein (CUT2 family) [Trinickia symbiotica]